MRLRAAKPGKIRVNVLFTCIGRRVSLLESFRRAARGLKIDARFLGTDRNDFSPAWQLCDTSLLVKPTSHPHYIRELLSIVRKYQVDMVVPTVDLDLQRLADSRRHFTRHGCHLLVSPSEVISVCQDKRQTFRFLKRHGFDTPATMSVRSALSRSRVGQTGMFPCYLKPWDGYGGRFNVKVNTRQELLFYANRIPHAICQEFVAGTEYTCDVYVDRRLSVRCVVPRRRLEIRAGEVSKAQVAKDSAIIQESVRLVEALGAGPGVITVQLIKTETGRHHFIEINPRFGGGAPLSIRAGADFPKWALQELVGKTPRIRLDGYTDGLAMLRYDAEVWVPQDAGVGGASHV